MVGGRGGSAKSDFISKGALIKHLMRGEGGSKKGKNHLTSYMDGPKMIHHIPKGSPINDVT